MNFRQRVWKREFQMSPQESHNPCDMLGTFRYIHLPSYGELIRHGIQELNEATQQHYAPVQAIRGGTIEAAQQDKQIFLFAANRSRPVFYQLMMVTDGGKILLPGAKSDHFWQAVNLLNLHSLLDKVTLLSLAVRSYGVFKKKCPPRRILTPEDAKQCGFEAPSNLDRYSSDRESLWWQQWNGTLYSCVLDAAPDHPVLVKIHITSMIGNYKPLPGGMLR